MTFRKLLLVPFVGFEFSFDQAVVFPQAIGVAANYQVGDGIRSEDARAQRFENSLAARKYFVLES
jgi:hypothetical protein